MKKHHYLIAFVLIVLLGLFIAGLIFAAKYFTKGDVSIPFVTSDAELILKSAKTEALDRCNKYGDGLPSVKSADQLPKIYNDAPSNLFDHTYEKKRDENHFVYEIYTCTNDNPQKVYDYYYNQLHKDAWFIDSNTQNGSIIYGTLVATKDIRTINIRIFDGKDVTSTNIAMATTLHYEDLLCKAENSSKYEDKFPTFNKDTIKSNEKVPVFFYPDISTYDYEHGYVLESNNDNATLVFCINNRDEEAMRKFFVSELQKSGWTLDASIQKYYVDGATFKPTLISATKGSKTVAIDIRSYNGNTYSIKVTQKQ